ncbi:MAG TPA: YetF domain-containing protein [Pyrinomonadaceae bacterium]|nr:YetF domain-containing protein [Pyrinomonadaceae bacterium]
MEFSAAEWLRVFAPETPVLEQIARGSALYLLILIITRIMPRRTGGELGMMDLIFVILIAEAASHSLGDYSSVADGVVMIGTLVACNYAINLLTYWSPFVERLVSSPPLQVVRNGKLLRQNLRRELITVEEFMSHLREEGIGDIKQVKSAHIEGDGKISFVCNKKQ